MMDTDSNISLFQTAPHLDKLTMTRPEILALNELIHKVVLIFLLRDLPY